MTAQIHPLPETDKHRLRRAFARKDALEAELRRVKAEIQSLAEPVSKELGYCVPLREEALRREI